MQLGSRGPHLVHLSWNLLLLEAHQEGQLRLVYFFLIGCVFRKGFNSSARESRHILAAHAPLQQVVLPRLKQAGAAVGPLAKNFLIAGISQGSSYVFLTNHSILKLVVVCGRGGVVIGALRYICRNSVLDLLEEGCLAERLCPLRRFVESHRN